MGRRRIFPWPFPSEQLLPSFPQPSDIGWRVLQCVYESESACTRLRHDRRIIRFLFLENSVRAHTPPSGRRRAARGGRLCRHTPHSRAGGGPSSAGPHLTPPSSPPPPQQRSGPAGEPQSGEEIDSEREFARLSATPASPNPAVLGHRVHGFRPRPQPCHPRTGVGRSRGSEEGGLGALVPATRPLSRLFQSVLPP